MNVPTHISFIQWIRDILGRTRIRILGSVHLITDTDPALFISDFKKMPTKNKPFSNFHWLLLFVGTFISVFKDKNNRNPCFSKFCACLWKDPDPGGPNNSGLIARKPFSLFCLFSSCWSRTEVWPLGTWPTPLGSPRTTWTASSAGIPYIPSLFSENWKNIEEILDTLYREISPQSRRVGTVYSNPDIHQ
jgi:hypothetical protein